MKVVSSFKKNGFSVLTTEELFYVNGGQDIIIEGSNNQVNTDGSHNNTNNAGNNGNHSGNNNGAGNSGGKNS